MFSVAFYVGRFCLFAIVTGLQTVHTTIPGKVLGWVSVALAFSWSEHRATTLIVLQNSTRPGAGEKINLSGYLFNSQINCCVVCFSISLNDNQYY